MGILDQYEKKKEKGIKERLMSLFYADLLLSQWIERGIMFFTRLSQIDYVNWVRESSIILVCFLDDLADAFDLKETY